MKVSVLWLAPLAFLYGIATRFRNYLYNIRYSKSINYDIMVVVVGNLSAGGTGKSPMTEYLVRLLHKKYSLAVLSRGYKRKTKGFLMADQYSTARDIGDEPYQMYLKYNEIAKIAVGEERTIAIPNILLEYPEPQVVVMDDGYQHRAVDADFKVLLTDYSHPFYNDHLLPWGRLREIKKGAKRANVVIVTKCPSSISDEEMNNMTNGIRRYAGADMHVLFSKILYTNLKPFLKLNGPPPERYIAFSGLANPDSFNQYVMRKYDILESVDFGDHHEYTEQDVEELVRKAESSGASLLTTEKDIVKFREKRLAKLVQSTNVYFLSIENQFIKSGNVFDELVFNAITEKYTVKED